MTTTFSNTLDELLSEDCASIKARERDTFDELAAPFQDRIVLFGTGGLGRRTLAGLRQVGIEPVAWADNDSRRWNTTLDGLPVLAPDEAVEQWGSRAVFVVTIWSDKIGHPVAAIAKQLGAPERARVISFASLYWKYAATFLPYFALDLPHQICSARNSVKRAAELWEDELSQQLYLAQLRWRLWLDGDSIEFLDAASSQTVLYSPSAVSARDVIIDCGAFDGDTLRAIMAQGGEFSRVIAVEPDPTNCEKLEAYVASLPKEKAQRIVLLPFAAGAVRETLRFSSNGSMQSALSPDGNIEVEAASLDEIAYDFAPTYIKFDIEGAEPEALKGCTRILSDYKPKMAVSAYHTFSHLWEIPLLIKDLAPDYSCRLHAAAKAGWDFMCLATPPDRRFE